MKDVADALLYPYHGAARILHVVQPEFPDDESLPPREPLEGWAFTGLLAQLEPRLYYRCRSPAVRRSSDATWGQCETHPWVVEVDYSTWSRDSELGAPRDVHVTLTWPSDVDPRTKPGWEAVVRVLERMVLHEMREGVWRGDDRILDPHVNACDVCCGHGGEDGECVPSVVPDGSPSEHRWVGEGADAVV